MKKDCKKFLQNEVEVFVDEGQLTLHGLAQYYCYLNENKKFEKLTHLLDTLAFNQTIIFVNRVDRAKKLTELLKQKIFNPICIHSNLKQEERIKNYDLFKSNGSRLLVATDLFGRGIDIERVNLVINYGISNSMQISPQTVIRISTELAELEDLELKVWLSILSNLMKKKIAIGQVTNKF